VYGSERAVDDSPDSTEPSSEAESVVEDSPDSTESPY
jgi:hypothetical protein